MFERVKPGSNKFAYVFSLNEIKSVNLIEKARVESLFGAAERDG